VGSNLVRFVDDGFGVVDVGTAEDHVRDGNDQSVVVDGVEQAIGGDGDAVVGFDHVNRAPYWRCASQKYMTEGKFMSL
jgi:hypothetical protein